MNADFLHVNSKICIVIAKFSFIKSDVYFDHSNESFVPIYLLFDVLHATFVLNNAKIEKKIFSKTRARGILGFFAQNFSWITCLRRLEAYYSSIYDDKIAKRARALLLGFLLN